MVEEVIGTNLLIGISGSINATSITTYLQYLRASFARYIKVIMTANATRIISPKVVELFTDDQVFIDPWDRSPAVERVPHIQLTQWADLFVILPATANIIGKAANGIADDLLSTAILCSTDPVVFVPAMNVAMWENKALRRNVQLLERDGHHIISPDSPAFAVGSQQPDAVTPKPETVLHYLEQVRIKLLREARSKLS
jgi:phosphopantothenoylcysteine decarboxylase / phosphopantothenate---cysteine ligase